MRTSNVICVFPKERRAQEAAEGAGAVAAHRHQGGHRQEDREQDRHRKEIRG